MPEMLTFDDAVIMTNEIISFFNSPQSDPTILFLARKFNLKIRDNFTVGVSAITKNCHECSGCHGGSCTLGCYISQDKGKAGQLCYWDQALEKVVGTKLVVHEMGHVIYDQIFYDGLNERDSFIKSEKFAQFMENHYDFDMSFNPDGFAHIEKMDFTGAKNSLWHIAELVVAFSIVGVITFAINRKFSKN